MIQAKPRWKNGMGSIPLKSTFLRKSQLDVESLWSEWIQEDGQERAGHISTVRGYSYSVNKTPTYDPKNGEIMGLGEGR